MLRNLLHVLLYVPMWMHNFVGWILLYVQSKKNLEPANICSPGFPFFCAGLTPSGLSTKVNVLFSSVWTWFIPGLVHSLMASSPRIFPALYCLCITVNQSSHNTSKHSAIFQQEQATRTAMFQQKHFIVSPENHIMFEPWTIIQSNKVQHKTDEIFWQQRCQILPGRSPQISAWLLKSSFPFFLLFLLYVDLLLSRLPISSCHVCQSFIPFFNWFQSIP